MRAVPSLTMTVDPLQQHRQDWEALGRLDPCWAVLSDSAKQYGKWNLDEFFATGKREVADVMEQAAGLCLPLRRDVALDFGCGIGRLTRALAEYFNTCYGVDISDSMVHQAISTTPPSNCRFLVNTENNLRRFADGSFDLIYSVLVLQHLPTRLLITAHLSEFLRTLREGGLLVFQLPSYIPFHKRLQLRRHLFTLLKSCGVDGGRIYTALGISPIRMTFIPEREVTDILGRADGRMLAIRSDSMSGPGIESRTYFVTK